MYLSQVEVKGFRNLKNNCVRFREGVNVVIGQNNSGKSNLLKGICLLLDHTTSKKLSIDDFCKYTTLEDLKISPPNIQVSIYLKQSREEELFADDLAMVFPWLIKLEEPYLAQLTYKYFLPESQKQNYLDAMGSVPDKQTAWDVIEEDFLRFYSSKIYGGNPALQQQADWDLLNKFDLQFLAAI
ncbi:MAG: AAA family ATPase, partial [Ignavibacteriaceae bacterium]|nr:AAA family ATPase [Ignavibacteriaceae bacterium]